MEIDWRADLHTHSTCSDGSLSPVELLARAAACGMKGISITDHDTIDAYDQLAAVAHPMAICPGVELTTQLEQHSVHVLAYGFDPQNTFLRQFCAERLQARLSRYLEMRDNLKRFGLPLPEVAPAIPKAVGRPHLAKEMVALGIVKSVKEGFIRYLHDDHPCYVPGERFETAETIQLLHENHVWAVLAHPMLYKSQWRMKVLDLPFDGVEVWYGDMYHHVAEWHKIAKIKGWICCGGSDFHGDAKPEITIGLSWTGKQTFDLLSTPRPGGLP